MKSRPVLIGNSIFASLNVLAAGAALGDVMGPTTFALFVLGVTAAQTGFNTYVQGAVVPTQDVAAYANSSGTVVAGPAAAVQNGAPVDVVTTP